MTTKEFEKMYSSQQKIKDLMELSTVLDPQLQSYLSEYTYLMQQITYHKKNLPPNYQKWKNQIQMQQDNDKIKQSKIDSTYQQIIEQRFNKNNIKLNKTVQQLMDRLKKDQERRKINSYVKSKRVIQQQLFTETFQPKLSANTQRICQEKKRQPLYLRYEKVKQEKDNKLKEQLIKKKKKQQQQYEEFLRQSSKYHPVVDQIRNYKNFFKQMTSWKTDKLEKSRHKRELNERERSSVLVKPANNKKNLTNQLS